MLNLALTASSLPSLSGLGAQPWSCSDRPALIETRATRSRQSQRPNDAQVAAKSRFAAHESQSPLAYRIASAKAPHSYVDERGLIDMDLDVDGAGALPLDHLHLAIIHEHTDHRVVDVELIHVVHAARRT